MMNDEYRNVLAIDTATRRLNLAVLYQGDRSVKSSELVARTHGQILLKKIDDLLSSAGLTSGELQALVVSLGPGSFTGLRIGLAAAKGMAVAIDIPIVGVTLFEVAAWRLKSIEGVAHVVIPSRKGEYFVGTVRDGAISDDDIDVIGEAALPERVGAGRVYTIGWEPGHLGDVALGLTAQSLEYDAGDVLNIGREKLYGSGGSDVATLEPVYLQKAIAEIRFDQRRRSQ